jgi:hypothetical protein
MRCLTFKISLLKHQNCDQRTARRRLMPRLCKAHFLRFAVDKDRKKLHVQRTAEKSRIVDQQG